MYREFARLLLAMLWLMSSAHGDASGASRLELLADRGRWAEIVHDSELVPARDADTDYYYGIALARLGRLEDARRALLAGHNLQPSDKRFLTELGGVAFQQKRYPEAARWLGRARKIDPQDSYVSDFLATVYFLQNNFEAALKYWNPIGKPQIQTVSVAPELRIDPVLLDRALLFSPASVLTLQQLLASERRVSGLGVFPQYTFVPSARDDGRFDIALRAFELDGFGSGRWAALLSTFRGAVYETIYPEYFDAGHGAVNVTSLVRWDKEKRRLALSFSGPAQNNPRYRYRLSLDLRNENWAIFPVLSKPAVVLGSLNLRTQGVTGEFLSFNSGRWDWSMGAEFSGRQDRNVFAGSALAPAVLLTGNELKQIARLDYTALRIPEKRLVLSSGVSAETAGIQSHTFEKLQSSLVTRWLPRTTGDDYAFQEQVRAGRTFGQIPFDELFMLGLERDNDLWMRAHIGTRDGRKGSAPLGRNYFLSNGQIDKKLYGNGLISVKLRPFLDVGKITDPLPGLGVRKWLWDTGAQTTFNVLGIGFTFTYGRDLRSGTNAFYAMAQP